MTDLVTEFQKLDDISIAYSEYGSGRDLILLHGNSGSKSIFRRHQTEHITMFHTIALDSRGHGQSISHDSKLSLDQISNDVIRFCKARSIRQADIIGYSDGGNVALLLAKKAPQLFPRIVAISPNTLVRGIEDDALHTIRRIHSFMGFLNHLGFGMKKHLLRFELMLKDIGISDDELKNIRSQVKILYAEKDMVKEEHLRRIARLIPGASLEKIPGCSHLSIINDERAIHAMRSFLLA